MPESLNLNKIVDSIHKIKFSENEREDFEIKEIIFSILKGEYKDNKNGEQKGFEEKESSKKSLEFEKNTFRIDSTWWKVPTEGKFAWKWVKVNPKGDVVEDLKTGEQYFLGYRNFLKYVAMDKWCAEREVEEKYLMTKEEFIEKMNGMSPEEYKDFYNKEIRNHLGGHWDPVTENFYGVGEVSNIWLVDGDNAEFSAHGFYSDSGNELFGFSGRLLKN